MRECVSWNSLEIAKLNPFLTVCHAVSRGALPLGLLFFYSYV